MKLSPEWDRRLKDHSKLKEVKLTLEWDMGLKDQLKLKLKEKEWVCMVGSIICYTRGGRKQCQKRKNFLVKNNIFRDMDSTRPADTLVTLMGRRSP